MPFIITNGSSYCHKTRTQAVEIVNDNASATRFSSRASAEKLLQRATKKLKGFEIVELQSDSRVPLTPKKAENSVMPKTEESGKSAAEDGQSGSSAQNQTSSSKRRRGRPKKEVAALDVQPAVSEEKKEVSEDPVRETAVKQAPPQEPVPEPSGKQNNKKPSEKEIIPQQPVNENLPESAAKVNTSSQPREKKPAPERKKSFFPVVRDIQAASASLWGDAPIVQPGLKKNRAANETQASAREASAEDSSREKHAEDSRRGKNRREDLRSAEVNSEETAAVQIAPVSEETPAAQTALDVKAAPAAQASPDVKAAPAVQAAPDVKAAPAAQTAPDMDTAPAVDTVPAVEGAPAVPSAPAGESSARENTMQEPFADRSSESFRRRSEQMRETSEKRSNRRRSNRRGQASRNMDSAAVETLPSSAEDIFSSDPLPQGKSSAANTFREDSETRQGTGKIRSTGKRIGKVSGNIHNARTDNETSQSKRRFFTTKERNMIYNRSEGHCGICGRFIPLEEYTIDHIIPLSKGGTNDLDNLQACCGFCNKAKDDSMGDEFFQRIQNIFLYQAQLKFGKKKLKKLKKALDEIEE